MPSLLLSSSTPGSDCPCCSIDAYFEQDLFLPSNTVQKESHTSSLGSNGTDSSLPSTPLLPSATQAWKQILPPTVPDSGGYTSCSSASPASILLVDSHGHAHLERESSSVYHVNDDITEHGDNAQNELADDSSPSTHSNQFLAVTCAVAPDDWQTCLQYAAQSKHRVAAVGVHPWYVDKLSSNWLHDLETILQQHERVMVGEIGICKVARFVRTYPEGRAAALTLQRQIFMQQFDLAATYQRPVTVHCVQQHQILFDLLKQRTMSGRTGSTTGLLPPAIALHSFTGTAHHVDQLLKWENEWRKRKRKKGLTSSRSGDNGSNDDEPLLYFGFSHMVNYAMCSSEKSRKQGCQAVRRVPLNRLLVESDVHSSQDSMGGTALACAYLAWALEARGNGSGPPPPPYCCEINSIGKVARQTTANALRFLSAISRAVTNRVQNE